MTMSLFPEMGIAAVSEPGCFFHLQPIVSYPPPTTLRILAMQAAPAVEEGKMLGDALNTVKIQVQQMKRHLVRRHYLHNPRIL
jgi:hypothetical protein